MSGVLAAIGGAFWIAKTWLIWATGGASATGGVVGLLFLTGSVCLAIAVALWAWAATKARAAPLRLVAVGSALVGLVLAVNLPILVGYVLFPGSWLAEEVGVVAVAVLAIVAWPVRLWPRLRMPA